MIFFNCQKIITKKASIKYDNVNYCIVMAIFKKCTYIGELLSLPLILNYGRWNERQTHLSRAWC